VTSRRAASGNDPLARLDRWLAQHRRRYHQGLRRGATGLELSALEALLKRPLPPELRTLLAWHNGQTDDFLGHFEQDWDLLSTEQIAAAQQDLPAECIPLLADDNGDYLCLDTRELGPPVKAFWSGKPTPETVAPSLTAWLSDFATAVERGAYQEDPERGTFLRVKESG